jgi:hypothetical protein
MLSAEQIVELYRNRQLKLGPLYEQMRRVRDLANGEVVVPLNELDRSAKSNVANLLVTGLDQMSMRIASTMPSPYFPPVKDGSERSKSYSRMRRKATLSFWDHNKMQMKLRRRARHLLAYSQSAVFLKPDFRTLQPKWVVRNPLDTYPAPVEDQDDMLPADCIFSHKVTAAWLLQNYGDLVSAQLRMGEVDNDSRYTLLEYVSPDALQLVVMGAEDNPELSPAQRAGMQEMLLEAIPNRTGMPLAVVANRITLDKQRGQFDGLIGMYYTRARLQALTEIAIERGIFPEEYLIARTGENPEIVQLDTRRTKRLTALSAKSVLRVQSLQSSAENPQRTSALVAVVRTCCQQPLTSAFKNRSQCLKRRFWKKTRLPLQSRRRTGAMYPRCSSCRRVLQLARKPTYRTRFGKPTSTTSRIRLLVQMLTPSSLGLASAWELAQ